MKLIDTHCHLTFESFETDLSAVIERAGAAGIGEMITIGCNRNDAEKVLILTEKYPQVFAAVSIHPTDIDPNFPADFEQITNLAESEKVVAIGETGLDLFRLENPPLALQIAAAEQHFELAKRLQKPVIIHSRAASAETLELLKKLNSHPFVLHCFAEDWDFAEKIFALGGIISFTGIVTYPKNIVLQEVVKKSPLEKIMVETDAPFLAPVPHRGERCEPAFVKDTAEFIANLRGISLEEFAVITTQNAERFFGL